MKKRNFLLALIIFSVFVFLLVGCDKKAKNVNVVDENGKSVSIENVNHTTKGYEGTPIVSPEGGYKNSPVGREMKQRNPINNVAYVELNDHNPLNMGNFYYEDQWIDKEKGLRKPFFDMVVLFAANIRWDSKNLRPTYWFNDNWVQVFDNGGYDKYIKPLRDKGIKVIIDIMPDHQGIGYMNMTQADVEYLVSRMKYVDDKWPVDGYDIDEEYADYGKIPQRSQSYESMKRFILEVRKQMPEKLITVYYYGFGNALNNNILVPDIYNYIDFSWPDYGGFHNSPQLSGLERKGWLAQSFQANQSPGSVSNASRQVETTIETGLGGFMFFNVNHVASSYSSYASSFSGIGQKIYGTNVIFEHDGPGAFYTKDWTAIAGSIQ